MENEGNAFMWLSGDARERGLHSPNYQSLGIGPWFQPRLEPLMLGNEHDPFQVMSAAALQDIRGGDFLKQQQLQYQQPFQFPQQSGITSPLLQQQFIQQTDPQQTICSQSQSISGNHNVLNQQLQQPSSEQQKQKIQEMQSYAQMFQLQNNCVQQQKLPVSSQLCQNLVVPDSSSNFSSVLSTNTVQSILSDGQSDGCANILNLSRLGQPMSEQNLQPWEPRLTMSQVNPFGSLGLLQSFPVKDGSVEADTSTADHHNHNVFGVNVDSSSLLANGVANPSASSFEANVSSGPYGSSCIQKSLYSYFDESSGLIQNGEESDPSTKTFVKVLRTRFSMNS